MNNFKEVQILGINMYYIVTFLIVVIIYGAYDWIKRNRIGYLRKMLLINIIVFSALLFLLISNNINEDRIKSGCLAIIIVSTVMLFRAKHDTRGDKALKMFNSQVIWRKKHIYFFPADFSDNEIDLIRFKLKTVFDCFKGNTYDKKIGDLFIWIKKKNNKVNIKIINQLDYNCDEHVEDIVNRYKDIEDRINGKLVIEGKQDLKIQLFIEHEDVA
ncbi:hypothetical protein [Clostridium sp. YIM B02551]|uniref:hypothetical protein n=1 Tax=Clostridium sp. YIM B02551 TaxID=2910679 RepID=UPI001EEB75FC|nr:hypothetical protein [Clostridium sp. YIM B02551]